jgi:hypothetical protein
MIVRKVRGQNKIDKVILSKGEVEFLKKMGIPLEKFVKEYLLLIAKKRKWKWYLKRKTHD